jgi:plasmid stability protein
MPNLLVRNVDEDIVMALKAQAGEHGVSAEAEHRRILEKALKRPTPRTLAQVLAAMPEAGLDEDFARSGDNHGRKTDVFD